MANLKLKNPAGGSLNFVSADGASDLTVTFPATTGTAMVSGNMPAFSAYASASQSVTTGVDTKVVFDTEQFDTNNNFASSRFTPTVAGYYQINTTVRFGGTTPSQYIIYWYKNGASIGIPVFLNANFGTLITPASTLEYMNGTTDYFELYSYTTNATTIGGSGSNAYLWFYGSMVRAA